MNQDRELNSTLLKGWGLIVIILAVSYLLEVVKGSRTLGYYLLFLSITVIPFLFAAVFYRKNPNSLRLKNYVIFGFLLTYVFVLFTEKSILGFTYIFPLLSLLILYHDKKLILGTGLFCLSSNLLKLSISYYFGNFPTERLYEAEIQIGVITLAFMFSYLASQIYGNIKNTNDAYNEELKHTAEQLSDMARQTITTIANTIDAKDAYTEGHSNRVAQYSRALAKKLGKSDEEADRIYNVALLHDIGKIGVPDSILNKPGRLTDEEFSVIRQHPSIGGRILHDVHSFPGLEIGARYHHERYDGRGYPDGLSGTEIPEIARIICVADCYDAMNSNRVYRKHFSKEYIISELEKCQGTQFDPVVAQAMLELLKDGSIDSIDQRTVNQFKEADRRKTESADNRNERRSVSSLTAEQDMEEVTQRMKEYLPQEEKDILDILGEENTIQKFEADAAESLNQGDGCLFIIDIDNFARLNHAYGFLCGDSCLRMISNVLLSEENCQICRYEGDSFLVFCHGIENESEASRRIEEVREKLYSAFSKEDTLMEMTVSAGAALSSVSGRKFAKMLGNAEQALKTAKKNGKNCMMIYQESGDEEKQASEKDLDSLSSLIEKEYSYKGAFELEYQEFGRVYELIRNLGIRNAQSVQLVLFTILFNDNADMPLSDRAMVMKYLESAINNTVRKVDVTARFSSTQRIVLFTNLPDKNVELVIGRIMKEFYRMIPNNQFRLVYVSRNINLSELRSQNPSGEREES